MGRADGAKDPRDGPLNHLVRALSSWRTAAVALLMFPSGLPFGLLVTALPAYFTLQGVDRATVGWLTLTQLPWTFKFLWAPLVDRFPLPLLGRKRGWIVLSQAALLALVTALAVTAAGPLRLGLLGVLALSIAFVAATQDIALDAYAVEVLRRDEQGVASGARTGFYRLAMYLSGGVAITASAWASWTVAFLALALLFLPSMVLTWRSPEPDRLPPPPRTLRETLWLPLRGLLGQRRAVEIAGFILLFKLPDNLAEALRGTFLLETGYSEFDVGLATGTIVVAGTIGGSLVGGALTTSFGLGRCLWTFGLLQIVSNLGYVAVAHWGVVPWLLYAAMGVETSINGMATGAFAVLLLRLTEKRFSASQYALLSSLFALGRTLAGPAAGVLAASLGWRDFFLLTMPAGLPGLLLLARFVPLRSRDPLFRTD